MDSEPMIADSAPLLVSKCHQQGRHFWSGVGRSWIIRSRTQSRYSVCDCYKSNKGRQLGDCAEHQSRRPVSPGCVLPGRSFHTRHFQRREAWTALSQDLSRSYNAHPPRSNYRFAGMAHLFRSDLFCCRGLGTPQRVLLFRQRGR